MTKVLSKIKSKDESYNFANFILLLFFNNKNLNNKETPHESYF